MEHELSAPLIGKVLDQVIDERESRITRQYRTASEELLKLTNNRSGVAFSHRPIVTRKEEGRHEYRPGRLDPQLTTSLAGVAPHYLIGHVTIAKQSHHLLGIGRARATNEFNGVSKCHE